MAKKPTGCFFQPSVRPVRGHQGIRPPFFSIRGPSANTPLFACAQFALAGLTDSLRRELAPHGVAVSLVAPGAIATPIVGKMTVPLAAMEQQLGPALWDVYGAMTAAFYRAREKSFESAATTDATNTPILHALTAPQPRALYICGTAGGAPAIVYAVLAWVLPTAWLDFVIAAGAK